ncbi:hypothetical protein D5086_001749 [Populus alba]|uniref:26.5 kDa class I small heat shock family protein n=2 Tax=Populus alba TaxID=43335 RepID=A0A4U5MZP0_POPAL|nr:26.5 kDa heat shock protein, mitochondrial-like isoform X1 [Populus alba]XP_034906174.1 26.5 kDa heat shock protein, mitochondrial-like isoform X1 [Populus alba]TKR74922.1 26.5 kDa class I small heat shock family protein [Populus alba]
MSLARLALRNLPRRTCFSASSSVNHGVSIDGVLGGVRRQRWNHDGLLKRFMTTTTSDQTAGETSDGKEVAVDKDGDKSKLFRRKKGKKGLWRKSDGIDFVPALYEFFPSGLGNALVQATDNINKLFQNLHIPSPSHLIGRVKEKDECYKLRYEVPGVSKEDLKITIDDGVLTIKGELKEEEEEGSDGEHWSMRSYGCYNTSIMLPDDAKADEIKAELKDGVLYLTIPRTEKPKKDVKEIDIH